MGCGQGFEKGRVKGALRVKCQWNGGNCQLESHLHELWSMAGHSWTCWSLDLWMLVYLRIPCGQVVNVDFYQINGESLPTLELFMTYWGQ